MSHEGVAGGDLRLYAYLLISFVLLLPVLLWPVATVIGLEPTFGASVESKWMISASLLLLVATVADSMFSNLTSLWQTLLHAVWIVLTVAVISLALQLPGTAYLLGLMFLIHSFRSALLLWRGEKGWWLWPAWMRDAVAALALFLWLALLPA